MRCKKCGWVSKYPVCDECASMDERGLIKKLGEISKKIRQNNRYLIRRHLRLPILSPLFYTAMFSLIILMCFSYFFAAHINNPLIHLFIGVIAPLILVVVIATTWGSIPEENIENGMRVVELKYQNNIFKRRKKKYRKLLSKPYINWSTDDKIEIRFNSYEAAIGEAI